MAEEYAAAVDLTITPTDLVVPTPPSDPLTDLLRQGARTLLALAVEAEVAAWIEARAHLRDAAGRRQVVRNGHHPERTIQTGLGRFGDGRRGRRAAVPGTGILVVAEDVPGRARGQAVGRSVRGDLMGHLAASLLAKGPSLEGAGYGVRVRPEEECSNEGPSRVHINFGVTLRKNSIDFEDGSSLRRCDRKIDVDARTDQVAAERTGKGLGLVINRFHGDAGEKWTCPATARAVADEREIRRPRRRPGTGRALSREWPVVMVAQRLGAPAHSEQPDGAWAVDRQGGLRPGRLVTTTGPRLRPIMGLMFNMV
jgi:hypothetical protein